jgi:hypothetical protein
VVGLWRRLFAWRQVDFKPATPSSGDSKIENPNPYGQVV